MKHFIEPIEGREGYFVSKDGRVFSQWVNKGRHGLVRGSELKELRSSLSMGRYKAIKFGRKSEWKSVHRIVYETFVGEIEEGKLIRHLNDDPTDNRVENLAQGTQKENMEDALKNGKLKLGEDNPNSKLSNTDIRVIRDIKRDYPKIPNRVIADSFSVSRRTVDKILKKEIWRKTI